MIFFVHNDITQEEGGCGIGVDEDIQKEKKKEEEENWEDEYTLGSATTTTLAFECIAAATPSGEGEDGGWTLEGVTIL